ncbi:MAG TPA: dienelactone hydrolase family protein [Stellaceae bacterium]|nr:dienelactone hydrolase family protein [Stellaceae bacterium]
MPNGAETVTQTIDVPSANGAIDCHLSRPAGEGKWPGVLMMTDVHGTRPAFEVMARRLASLGYVVLLPNVYYRGGHAPLWDLSLPRDNPEVEGVRARMRATLTPDAIVPDMGAGLDYLAGLGQVGGAKMGVVGYCMSGSFALRAAAAFPDKVAAAASFHGGRLVTEDADSPHLTIPNVRGELYFAHADQDNSMTTAMIDRLEKALDAAGRTFHSELYTGARHGFAVSDVPAYDPKACGRHWLALTELLGRTLAA